ncbi:putative prophage lambdaCh01, transcriptional regulator [Peptoclostridium acidaminophilum DSM 3953]|uniref:Putative prophage lambdaCh01, transcriptional regulator n=1 Tax=Peptoclostridium acidaminophilum DSM 3953 TaxID=1286171 RepID=W8T3N9_PEPAC|nr:helix-turn-helix transcriptional regulator [Peptoclostridium acidaminophilum]AHM56384.1 putative prophage lambdaCh01, transcriptional regulator [Peptoclostridium acidaminophilum DSM 3953]
MKAQCKNMYQNARQLAGLTQLMAAEYLNVSVRSLADYETNRTIPPEDIVCAMDKLYNARWLVYMHMKQNTLLGRIYLPDVEFSDVAKSVLRLQKEMHDLSKINNSMIEIACDGIVDKYEEQKWERITKEVDDVAGAAMALIFSK